MAQVDYDQKVIVLVSDGASAPTLASADYNAMIARAQAFKQSGGIIICVGMNATGAGYALLQRLATAGYFTNVLGATAGSVNAAANWLIDLMGMYCAGPGGHGPYTELY